METSPLGAPLSPWTSLSTHKGSVLSEIDGVQYNYIFPITYAVVSQVSVQ